MLVSEVMAKAIPKDSHSQYYAIVNIDSAGFNTLFSLPQATKFKLVKIAKTVAEEAK